VVGHGGGGAGIFQPIYSISSPFLPRSERGKRVITEFQEEKTANKFKKSEISFSAILFTLGYWDGTGKKN